MLTKSISTQLITVISSKFLNQIKSNSIKTNSNGRKGLMGFALSRVVTLAFYPSRAVTHQAWPRPFPTSASSSSQADWALRLSRACSNSKVEVMELERDGVYRWKRDETARFKSSSYERRYTFIVRSTRNQVTMDQVMKRKLGFRRTTSSIIVEWSLPGLALMLISSTKR